MYRDRIHCSEIEVVPSPVLALEIGVDFGLTPAAVIGQKFPDGRWLILDEVTTDNCGITRFGELLVKYMATYYPSHHIAAVYGDPAGNARDQDENTAFDLLKAATGWHDKIKPAPSNDFSVRQEAVITALSRLIDGNPGFLLSPKCRKLRKGFTGGYHFKSIRTGNGTQYHDTPNKNEYSHPNDALQYLLLGGGEFDAVFNRVKKRARSGAPAQVAKDVDYNPFGDG
jgi:hypothetical protein